ncbi:MAG: phosphoribosylamine--glycine ligase, partial [Candidatus Aenigmarchaeota archaeon]|nr:phosphoribosylamine--glycine ligase [Candidatus Aenigmarchaeota archaeon]
MTVKVLLIGNGAREHSIAEAVRNSPQNPSLFSYIKSNNPGIRSLSKHSEIGEYDDLAKVTNFANQVKPDFCVIGPEAPLDLGVVDSLARVGIPSIGPTKELAKLETSKSFTRLLMEKYNIPGLPEFKVFTSMDGVKEFLYSLDSFVVKPDGLTGGKGVKVHGEHLEGTEDALKYCEEVLKTHPSVIVEERLEGEEFSLQSFTDGKFVL